MISGIDFYFADAGGRNSFEDEDYAYTMLCEECGQTWDTDDLGGICASGHEDVSLVRGVDPSE